MANPTCEPAKAIITLSTPDGGTEFIFPTVFGFPPFVIQTFFPQLSSDDVMNFAQAAQTTPLVLENQECAARCAEEAKGKETGMEH